MARSLEEILKEAKELGGRFIFTELSEEDAKVLENYHVQYNVLYPLGSSNRVAAPKEQEKAQDFSALPSDLKKSYDFWNSLNKTEAEKAGSQAVTYQMTNMDNKSLLVEGKRDDKVVFKGVDHGRKGFDIVKTSELPSCEQLDRVVKRAKFLNPKTVIRIKDNVTDPVLRNKMLIACALNNVKPVGNLPENFDFAELRRFVKDTDAKDYEALSKVLYMPQSNEFALGNEDIETLQAENTAAPRPLAETQARRTTVAASQVKHYGDTRERRGDETVVAPAVVSTHRETAEEPRSAAATEVKKESWGRRAWRKAKGWVIGGAIIAASIFGYKSCENTNNDKKQEPIEVVAKPQINSLADLRNPSTLDYLLNDWNKDGQVSVEDFQGVDWNNDGMLDFRDNELAHKIFEIVKKYRQAKDCADAKLLDSIEKEMDALVKKNCGEEKKNVRRTPIRTPAPQVVHDTVYVKGDTVYLKADPKIIRDTVTVHDTVFVDKPTPKVATPEPQKNDHLLDGHEEGVRDVHGDYRVINEEGNGTEGTTKKTTVKSKGRRLTVREIENLKNTHTK